MVTRTPETPTTAIPRMPETPTSETPTLLDGKGFYFYVATRASMRGCQYNMSTMLAALCEALHRIPEEYRPRLYRKRKGGDYYDLLCIRQDYGSTKEELGENELRAMRKLLESAVRRVHPKAAYQFGFDNLSSQVRPSLAYLLTRTDPTTEVTWIT